MRLLVSVLFCVGLVSAASANDGGISFGGSPGLLKGHPTVLMRSEVIRMTVGEEVVTVDCRFVFENSGPACTVRMGFPDEGRGADDPDEDEPHNPPTGTFTSFRSYVDGHPVATQLIRAAARSRYWHAKTVVFPAHSRHVVRDVYTVTVGAQITPVNSNAHQTSYILHTGASWHGPIGRTEVIVKFDRKRMTGPLAPQRVTAGQLRKSRGSPVWGRDWSKQRNRVYYQGPSRPEVDGTTLRFLRSNWRPASKDDIYLVFDNQKAGSN